MIQWNLGWKVYSDKLYEQLILKNAGVDFWQDWRITDKCKKQEVSNLTVPGLTNIELKSCIQ
jgi:hypothetical protein